MIENSLINKHHEEWEIVHQWLYIMNTWVVDHWCKSTADNYSCVANLEYPFHALSPAKNQEMQLNIERINKIQRWNNSIWDKLGNIDFLRRLNVLDLLNGTNIIVILIKIDAMKQILLNSAPNSTDDKHFMLSNHNAEYTSTWKCSQISNFRRSLN